MLDAPALVHDLALLEDVCTLRPLTTWRAWDRDPPRTSQRRALQLLEHTKEAAFFGGNRCLAGDTLVDTIDGPQRIDSIKDGTLVRTLYGWRSALAIPRKGPDPLFRVTLDDGSSFVATAAHRVISRDAWTSVSELRPGSWLYRPPSGNEGDLRVRTIEAVQTDYHYDIEVPDAGHFLAQNGVVHHNSGKTEMCRAALVAICSGSDHPDSQAFWSANGVDYRAFPKGPGVGWAIAITSGDSLRYHRRQVLSLIPKWGPRHPDSEGDGRSWHSWNLFGRSEARLQWMVPGYDTPAEIWFKSEDQDIMTFQGDAIRCAWHDEEGVNEKRYVQVQYRLIDQDGYQILSDTPIHGRTWVYNRFITKKDEKGKDIKDHVLTANIHTADNPYLPKHRVAKVKDDAVRGRGEFVVLEGRIWPEFGHLHQLPLFELPKDAYLFRSIDFGTRHPFACLNAAVLKRPLTVHGRRLKDGSIIIYRERYARECTLSQHVTAIREAEGWRKIPSKVRTDDNEVTWTWVPAREDAEHIEATWADPEDAQQMLQMNHVHGITTFPGKKDIRAGIDAIKERLTPGPDGEPSLYVMTTCPNVIREWEDYVWTKRMTAEGVEKDEPSDRSDHTCDAGRYLVMGIDLGFALE